MQGPRGSKKYERNIMGANLNKANQFAASAAGLANARRCLRR